MRLESLDRDIGALLRRAKFKRLKITLLNLDSVRRDMNLYSLINNLRYGLVVFATLFLVFTRPPALISMPILIDTEGFEPGLEVLSHYVLEPKWLRHGLVVFATLFL